MNKIYLFSTKGGSIEGFRYREKGEAVSDYAANSRVGGVGGERGEESERDAELVIHFGLPFTTPFLLSGVPRRVQGWAMIACACRDRG